MKKNTYRGIVLLVLAVVILATVLVQHFWGAGGTEDAKPLPEKEKQEEEEPLGKTIEEPWMPKHEIQTYENQPEDNRELPPSDLEVTFTGYAEHPEAFGWMDPGSVGNLSGVLKRVSGKERVSGCDRSESPSRQHTGSECV